MKKENTLRFRNRTSMDTEVRRSQRVGWLLYLLLAGVLVLTVALMQPPVAVPANAPDAQFSGERAMETVQSLAQAPHPPASAEHDRVRDRIVARFRALGYETRIQKTVVVRDFNFCIKAATVENIVALRTTDSETPRLLLLAAHYDSHPEGPGAGDDAAGVATLLEVARAEQHNQTSACDLAFVVTDAEEQGLLGARAFSEAAATFWKGRFDARKRDIIALNFEGRGAAGPVFMFETGNGNQSLIDRLGSVPHPTATSLMYALYKTLPNDTDLTVFKQAGMRGMNFAFADRWSHYHTALDTAAGLDPRSVQHHGDYALSLVRTIADRWPLPSSGDAIYFDVLGIFLVRYPVTGVWPLTLFAIALYAVNIFHFRQDRQAVGAFFAGAGAFLLTVVLCTITAIGVVQLMDSFRAGTPYRDAYAPRWFEASFFCLTFAVATAVWVPFLRRLSSALVVLGALLWWLIALIATTVMLPGATYLFLWPFVFVLLSLLLPVRLALPATVTAGMVTIVLFTPIYHGLSLLLGFGRPEALALLVAFGLAPLLPTVRASLSLWPPVALFVLGSVLFLAAGQQSQGPQTSTLLFAQDFDNHTAVWATLDKKDTPGNGGYLRGSTEKRSGNYFFPWYSAEYRVATAPLRPLPPPQIERAGNTMTITSKRRAPEVIFSSDRPIRSLKIAGKTYDLQNRPLCLRFLAPPETITLALDADQDTLLTITESSFGLPEGTLNRPPDYIAAPVPSLTDRTLTKRTIRW